MANLDGWVSTMAVALACGLFVDFYIGKAGQKKVREYLEGLWIQFSYASAADIVRTESRIAGKLLAIIFGQKLFSLRKLAILSLVMLVITSVMAAAGALRYGLTRENFGDEFGFSVADYIGYLIRASLSIAASLYLARLVSNSKLSGALVGAVVFCLLLALQVLITLSPFAVDSYSRGGWTTPFHKTLILGIQKGLDPYFDFDVTSTWSNEITNLLLQPVNLLMGMWVSVTNYPDTVRAVPHCSYLLDLKSWRPYLFWGGGLSLRCAELGVSLVRIFIVGIFTLTLLLYPARKFLMNLWLRVLESDKPVFTVVFGGVAALFKTGQELAKLF